MSLEIELQLTVCKQDIETMDDLETEIWKDIPGYERYYQVSSNGQVKSLERTVIHKNGFKQKMPSIIRKPKMSRNGYLRIELQKNNIGKGFGVHQLVAMAFLNHKLDRHIIVVDHIDNNRLNNKLSNLQLISHRKNSTKNIKTGSSIYTGVCWHKVKKQWISQIRINGRIKNLGYFDNEEDASKYYQKALDAILNGKEVEVKNVVFSSKLKGVHWNRSAKKWSATITRKGIIKKLGNFTHEYEAGEAYENARIEFDKNGKFL